MREDLEGYLAQGGPAVRSEDLGRLMLSHFAVERAALRREVQELMAAESSMQGSAPRSVPQLMAAPAREMSPSVPPGPDSLSPLMRPDSVVVPRSVPTEEPLLPFARDRRRRRYTAVGFVALLLGGLGTLLGFAGTPKQQRLAAPAAAVAPPAAPQPEAKPAAAPPPVTPESLPVAPSAAPQAEPPPHAEPARAAPAPRARRAPPAPRPLPPMPRMPLPPRGEVVRAEPAPTGPEVSVTASTSLPRVRLVEDKPRVPLVE
jgi:hypothetical protein